MRTALTSSALSNAKRPVGRIVKLWGTIYNASQSANPDLTRDFIMMADFQHDSVRHSVGEYVSGMAHTDGAESFWALLKQGHYRTHHSMSAKHLYRYIDEFSTRHNTRKRGMLAKIEQTIAGAPARNCIGGS